MSWFYQRETEQIGPVGFDELRRLADTGAITRDTLVWSEGMEQWQPASTIENLFFAPPPVPGAGTPQPPGAPQPQPFNPPHINNHLTKAILSTILCCLPLGIVAIVKAAQVNGKIEAGNLRDAVQASDEADNWANWSIGVGLVAELLYFFVIILAGVSG